MLGGFTVFSFIIDGEPATKGRPRVTRSGHAYTPKATKDAEAAVLAAFQAQGGRMFDGLLMVSIWVHTNSARRKDLDNIAKLVTDALNGHAYADDSQIDDLHIIRFWGADFPRTVVRIARIES